MHEDALYTIYANTMMSERRMYDYTSHRSEAIYGVFDKSWRQASLSPGTLDI